MLPNIIVNSTMYLRKMLPDTGLSAGYMLHAKQNKRNDVLMIAFLGIIGLLTTLLLIKFMPQVFATDAETTGKDMIENVVKIVCIIVMIVGGLFCLVGVVKFAIAHAENQGPEQQKATLMLATGIVLIVLPAVLNGLNLGSLVSNAITNSGLNTTTGTGATTTPKKP